MRTTVTPYLTVSPAEDAIAFYIKVFKAKEVVRRMADDGKRVMHCELTIAEGTVMLADAFPEHGGPVSPAAGALSSVTINLDMAKPSDIDASAARALGSGAIIEMKPHDTFWGTRFAKFRDPFGHRWMMNAPLET